eukprot:CAMPEP_0115478412 /NCGR_PEP_ID=MMETSP0271-20121206/56193_1 /TAXON_ID=71861 /ORGANISM="Scrippsiella trochoidea, Strain CCMP3099" /LENGTH=55 /DNA_ID=CAMNT_0002905963 /DNA_START=36 /DNA_END=200 /DNA_ORIENTATION=+
MAVKPSTAANAIAASTFVSLGDSPAPSNETLAGTMALAPGDVEEGPGFCLARRAK